MEDKVFKVAVLTSFLQALPAVLVVVDPVGVVPVLLAMMPSADGPKLKSTALRACLVAGVLLIFFAIFGGYLFAAFGITLDAFQVAGGILLILTALDMWRAQQPATRHTPDETREGLAQADIAVVPLGMPLIAGPGAVVTVMVLMGDARANPLPAVGILLAIVVAMVVSYFVLSSAAYVRRILRQTGIAIVERVIGLLLAALGVQFIFDGARRLMA